MEIVRTIDVTTNTPHRKFRLRGDFLESYYERKDPFRTLLARSTYLTKYSRNGETWTDTIRRVVEGNLALANTHDQREAEMLFHLFWTGQCLPPGRGLWVGGVEGIPADARFNCWYVTLRGVDDWCWLMNQLMLGGGVGLGLSDIDHLSPVTQNNARFAVWCRSDHPNISEVNPNDKSFLNGRTPVFRVPDSREGWVEAFRRATLAAFTGSDLIVDVSDVRPRGEPIKTFGGIACGPGPLTHLLRSSWDIVRSAQGRQLTSVECLDITNMIGFCVKSGNVRRSALIVLGDAEDQAFRDAKKDFNKVLSHRHTSNNSIVFRSWEQIRGFDWEGLVQDNITYGEPGLLNLPLAWKTDPEAKGVNPCGEVVLHDRESCNLAEVFPAQFEDGINEETAFRLVTRYCLRQRLTPLSDPQADLVSTKNMRLGVGLGGLCDFDWNEDQLATWYGHCRKEASDYARELRVSDPLTVTTVKPSGTISLLNGSSPGIHAPYAAYYIRRARLAANDPMVPSLQEAGVPWEYDQYDQTRHTLVFSFPMKAPHTRVTVQSQTIQDQFERQAQVQEFWADNAVSATLSFDPETERGYMADLLRNYVPRFKSTSMLARSGHGYVQAPYEAVSEEVYREMQSKIRHEHQLSTGGDMDGLDECSSGACPIR